MYGLCSQSVWCHEISVHQQHSSSSTTPAVFYVLAFVPVVTVYVCGWCIAGDRVTMTFSRPTRQLSTLRRTSYQLYDAHSSSISSSYLSLEPPLFWTCDAPEISRKPHPEGEPGMHMNNMFLFCFFWHAVLQQPRVLSRAFDFGASKGTVGTLRRMSGSRPSPVARALSIQTHRAGSFVKGLRSASLSRVGAWKVLYNMGICVIPV